VVHLEMRWCCELRQEAWGVRLCSQERLGSGCMASVPPDSPGASEGGNPALGAPNVKGAKLLYVVS